jgi:excinuclease ABC subunit A
MGPEGGEEGGVLLAAGTPEEVAAVDASYTGRFLREAGIEPASRPARGARARAGANGAPRGTKVKAAA